MNYNITKPNQNKQTMSSHYGLYGPYMGPYSQAPADAGIESVYWRWCYCQYAQISHTSRTILVDEIVDRSDVFGASPVGAAPTTSSFST